MSSFLRNVLLIAVVIIPAFFLNLGQRDIYKIQEVRVAETAREMLHAHEWIVPTYNGELRLQKPPLPYWATMLSYQAFGVKAMAARLPAAVFGALAVLLLFGMTRKLTTDSQALKTALIFGISFIGLKYFRSGEADSMLIFFISLTCLAGFQLSQGLAGRFTVLLFYLGLGLGFLTKGPAAIAIPILTLLLFGGWNKNLKSLKPLLNVWGILLFIILAFGWYGWIWWQMPEIAHGFLARQLDETFISGTHIKPFYWYLQHALDFYFPWSLFLIPAACWSFKYGTNSPLMRFSLVWLAVVFVLLMLTLNKQVQYALLFAPPLAIWLGSYLHNAADKWVMFNRYLIRALLALSLFAMIVLGVKSQQLQLVILSIVMVLSVLKLADSTQKKEFTILALLLSIVFVQIETNQSKKAEKTDIPQLMAHAQSYAPLYQLAPGDGAFSYYANRVVPIISREAIVGKLEEQPELWVLTETEADLSGLHAEKKVALEQHAIWRISKSP